MRVFRRVRKDDRGRKRESARYYLEFRDANGIERRLLALEDRGASEALGRRVKRLVELRVAREKPEPDLLRWLPEHVRRDLVRIGLLDAEAAGRAMSLDGLLTEFEASLNTRDRTASWTRRVVRRARDTFSAADFSTLSDVEPTAIERHLKARRDEKRKNKAGEELP